MRAIKFRGRREASGHSWVYGYYWHICGHFIKGKDGVDYPVDYRTVGQYTGLKDKNGVEIYEGDIVRFTKGIYGYKSTYDTYITKVEYCVQKCGISQFEPFCTSDMIECEVIGNIYDNKDLCGEKK